MVDSLTNNLKESIIWVLCLDALTFKVIKSLDRQSINPLPLYELENNYPNLKESKKNRSLSEYYFTLTPFLPRWILSQNPNIGSVTYIDADIQFFASPITLLKKYKIIQLVSLSTGFTKVLTKPYLVEGLM